MSVKFKPLKDRVFASYTEEMEKTAGGLYIPDSAKAWPLRYSWSLLRQVLNGTVRGRRGKPALPASQREVA